MLRDHTGACADGVNNASQAPRIYRRNSSGNLDTRGTTPTSRLKQDASVWLRQPATHLTATFHWLSSNSCNLFETVEIFLPASKGKFGLTRAKAKMMQKKKTNTRTHHFILQRSRRPRKHSDFSRFLSAARSPQTACSFSFASFFFCFSFLSTTRRCVADCVEKRTNKKTPIQCEHIPLTTIPDSHNKTERTAEN